MFSLIAAVGIMATDLISLGGGNPSNLERFEFAQVHMGVSFRIALYAPDEATANRAAEQAFARIEELDGVFSDYDPQSELMRLCRAASATEAVRVSPPLAEVLRESLALSEASRGAFDITVGPAVRLWRRARRNHRLPSPRRLAEARAQIGYEAVQLDEAQRTVRLLKSPMRLDLGGIAKGYAADEALAQLRQAGVTRAMIDASGDLALGDPPPDREGWRVGVAPLDAEKTQASRILFVANRGVATSGDAFQHVEIDGRRYSHIVDPRTGIGLTSPSSVTVIAPTGWQADGLASALSVLGPKQGLALIEKTPGTAALFVVQEGDQVKTYVSRRFGCYEKREPESAE
jgi:thiamine biosynthesis lipoprotein